MKILVCIKQVPDLESRFQINSEGIWFSETDLAWRMNEYDEYAVEQAVQLKEQLGGETELAVLSIGPDRVKEAIKKALAMGCDRGVHVKDDADYRLDPFEVSAIIAEYARGQQFDVIFTGFQSQDRGSAQVGVLVAELLGMPSVTTVVGFEFADGVITARRELEGGVKAVVKAATPALVTCQLGLNTPRYPTLPNIMKAKKKELQTVAVADLLKAEAVQEVEAIFPPEKKGGGLVLEGDAGELADKLLGLLKDKAGVLRS
jgi:electron transfer flavoprotein beta subunit